MLVEGKQQCPNRTGKVAIVTSGAIQFNYPPPPTPPPPLLMTGFWSDPSENCFWFYLLQKLAFTVRYPEEKEKLHSPYLY